MNKFLIATLLAMCVIGFSMSSVSAKDYYYDNVLEVNKWYEWSEIKCQTWGPLYNDLSYGDNQNLVKDGVVEYYDNIYDLSYSTIVKIKPLKAGEYYTETGLINKYHYHWVFVNAYNYNHEGKIGDSWTISQYNYLNDGYTAEEALNAFRDSRLFEETMSFERVCIGLNKFESIPAYTFTAIKSDSKQITHKDLQANRYYNFNIQ